MNSKILRVPADPAVSRKPISRGENILRGIVRFKHLQLLVLFASMTSSANAMSTEKLSPTLPCAQTAKEVPRSYLGDWGFFLGKRALFILHLPEDALSAGYLERPTSYGAVGSVFYSISGTPHREAIVSACSDSSGIVHLSLKAIHGGTDAFTLRLQPDGNLVVTLELSAPGMLPGRTFVRLQSPGSIATDWESSRAYSVVDSDTDSEQMAVIYAKDQADRSGEESDLAAKDRERRKQTLQLLADGRLATGRDMERAAYIFQHGESADDYLLACILAAIALSKGQTSAIWLHSAALDRYLQATDHRQVFGTQFVPSKDGLLSQEPFNKDLVPTKVRDLSGVPSLSFQQEQLKLLNAKTTHTQPAPPKNQR